MYNRPSVLFLLHQWFKVDLQNVKSLILSQVLSTCLRERWVHMQYMMAESTHVKWNGGMRQHLDILRQKHMSEISWGLRPDSVKCYFLVGLKCNHMDFLFHFVWEETFDNDLNLSSLFFSSQKPKDLTLFHLVRYVLYFTFFLATQTFKNNCKFIFH